MGSKPYILYYPLHSAMDLKILPPRRHPQGGKTPSLKVSLSTDQSSNSVARMSRAERLLLRAFIKKLGVFVGGWSCSLRVLIVALTFPFGHADARSVPHA